ARAQCNDAYWHGVFGGLYLPHLREAIWRELAAAEAELRQGDALASEVIDFDGDGHEEIWVHCDTFSAVVSPRRGGAIEELTLFATGVNYANALTRRREAYHEEALERHAERREAAAGGAPSIHDIEAGIQLDVRPPVDRDDRALLLERLLPAALTKEMYSTGEYETVWNWAPVAFEGTLRPAGESIEIELRAERLVKRLRFERDATITVDYEWEPGEPGTVFATELSLFRPIAIASEPAAAEWRFPIETVAKSERGLDRTLQGESVTLRWPGERGHANVRLQPGF
ncbi:MAG: DUF1926 domain-containing protein, partial [Gemmatimonadales bacterium]|nr:DUF1926 domain-containing protein [Gemmatimonadales bacterium]